MEKRVQTNNDNFFISGSQKETPTRPGFFNFLGLQNKRNKEVQPQPQPISQPQPQPQPQEEEATQLIHETSNVLNRVQNMNQTIAQINNQNQNKSKSKSSRESSNIGELKEVIQKLYDVVYKIYRIQLLTNNQKTRLLNVIQRNLNKNKDFLQVMNRIIEENNKVKEPTSAPSSNRENNQPPTNNMQNRVNNTASPPTNSEPPANNGSSSSLNNLFRNINSIPTNRNRNRNQTAAEPEPTAELAEEEPEPEVPNLVLSNRKISEIMKEENEESNVRLSNLLRNKNKNKNVNVPANNSGVLVENVVNSETKSREKRINRSRKLMTLLSTINPISLNVAKQKLQNYQK